MKHVESLAKTRRYPVEIATHEDGVLVAAHISVHVKSSVVDFLAGSRSLTLVGVRNKRLATPRLAISINRNIFQLLNSSRTMEMEITALPKIRS